MTIIIVIIIIQSIIKKIGETVIQWIYICIKTEKYKN